MSSHQVRGAIHGGGWGAQNIPTPSCDSWFIDLLVDSKVLTGDRGLDPIWQKKGLIRLVLGKDS